MTIEDLPRMSMIEALQFLWDATGVRADPLAMSLEEELRFLWQSQEVVAFLEARMKEVRSNLQARMGADKCALTAGGLVATWVQPRPRQTVRVNDIRTIVTMLRSRGQEQYADWVDSAVQEVVPQGHVRITLAPQRTPLANLGG